MPPSSAPSSPFVHISIRTYAHSFSATESPLEPLLQVGVHVSSNASIHEVQIGIPAVSRQALAATIISAFRNPSQLVVHAGDECEFSDLRPDPID